MRGLHSGGTALRHAALIRLPRYQSLYLQIAGLSMKLMMGTQMSIMWEMLTESALGFSAVIITCAGPTAGVHGGEQRWEGGRGAGRRLQLRVPALRVQGVNKGVNDGREVWERGVKCAAPLLNLL